jgi:hypothetical protein
MASTEYREAGFAHRQNRDESFESICLHCFRTVAIAESEQRLFSLESTHRCPGKYIPTSALNDEDTLPT